MNDSKDALGWMINTLAGGFGIPIENMSFVIFGNSAYVYITGYLDDDTDYCVSYQGFFGGKDATLRLSLVRRDNKLFIRDLDVEIVNTTYALSAVLPWLNEMVYRMKQGAGSERG